MQTLREGKITHTSFKHAPLTYSQQAGRILVILGAIALIVTILSCILSHIPWGKSEASLTISDSMAGNYLAAEYAFKHQNFNDASQLFIAGLKQAPHNSKILENAYLMLLLSGQVDEALALIKHHNTSNSTPIMSTILHALHAFKEGNYSQARHILETDTSDKSTVNTIITPFLLSWCDVGERRYSAALERLRHVPGGSGNHAFIAYQMALIYDIAGQEDDAAKQFSIALKDAENSYRFIKAAGNFYERTQQHNKAALLYQNYLADNPSSTVFKKDLERINKHLPVMPDRIIDNASEGISQILLEVASGFYKERLFVEAQIYLQMVLYLDPNSPQAHFLLANYYENTDDFNEAIFHYQHIRRNSDFYWQSQVNIALNLFKMGKLESAKEHLLSLSKLRPSDYEVLLILADILRSESRLQEAINLYNQILSGMTNTPPYYWYAYYMRAVTYDQAQMPDKAEADLLEALKLNPNQEEVLNYLGYSWVNTGKNITKAKAIIQRALAQQPENPQFIDSMGWALFAEGNYDEAIRYLENALELLPTDPIINDHLGDAYFKAGRHLEAKFQWQRALRFSPEADEEANIKAKLINPQEQFP